MQKKNFENKRNWKFLEFLFCIFSGLGYLKNSINKKSSNKRKFLDSIDLHNGDAYFDSQGKWRLADNVKKRWCKVIAQEIEDENQEPYVDPDSKLSNKVLFQREFHNGAFSIYKWRLYNIAYIHRLSLHFLALSERLKTVMK